MEADVAVAATSQGTPAAGTGEGGSSPGGFGERRALRTPSFWPSSLQNNETMNSLCFKLPGIWHLVAGVPGNSGTVDLRVGRLAGDLMT